MIKHVEIVEIVGLVCLVMAGCVIGLLIPVMNRWGWRRLMIWAYGLAFVAWLLGGSAARENPGGPYISFFGDMLAWWAAVFAMCLSLTCIFLSKPGLRLPLTLLVMPVFAIGLTGIRNSINGIYEFWTNPWSRGYFLGF